MNYEKKEIRLKAPEAVCPLNGQEGQLLLPLASPDYIISWPLLIKQEKAGDRS